MDYMYLPHEFSTILHTQLALLPIYCTHKYFCKVNHTAHTDIFNIFKYTPMSH